MASRTFLFSLIVLLLCVCGQKDKKKQPWNPDDSFCGPKNCYEILGAESTETKLEIKKKFRDLATEFHPDKNSSPEAQALMTEINMANDVLSSEERRKQYDAMLKVRKAIDAPKENAFIVFFVLFLLMAFLVLQYKAQQYRNLKLQLVLNSKIRKELKTQPPTVAGEKKSKKSKRVKKPKVDEDPDLSLFDDAEITEAIKSTGLEVEGWPGSEPTFLGACMTVLQSPITLTFAVISGVWGLVMGGDDEESKEKES